MTELTDAEKAAQEAEMLAVARAEMFAATEKAKAAQLPSAVRAVEVLTGNAAIIALEVLREAIAANVDDLPRPHGTPGAEGTKQMLQRIVTSMESGLAAAQARVQALQPTPAPATPTEPVA